MLLIVTLVCGYSRADASQSKNSNGIYWINGRGLIQHYQSLQAASAEWKAGADLKGTNPLPENMDACVSVQKHTVDVFDECSKIGLNEVRRTVSNRQSVDPDFLQKLKIFSSVWERPERSAKWETWVRLASAAVLAGDFKYSASMIKKARESLQSGDSSASWKIERTEAFEKALSSLTETTSGSENPIRSQNLSDIARQRWILAQDRDEITALKSMILNSEFSLEVVRRIDSLVRQHQFYSREWQAIINVISAIAGKVELFERNKGLMLPLEWWIGRQATDNRLSLNFDDDSLLVRQHHIQDELTRTLAGMTSDLIEKIADPLDKKQALLLNERLNSMNSPVSRALNNLPTSEAEQFTGAIRRKIRGQDDALRRLQARLAAQDLTGMPNAEFISALTGFNSEVKSLRLERANLLADYMSMSVNLMPVTSSGFVLLMTRNDQLRKTLQDLRKLISGIQRESLEGTQAGYFFVEADQLLDRIVFESKLHMAQKTNQARRFSAAFRSLSSGVSGLRDDFMKAMIQSGRQIRVPLTKILLAIESDLYRRERALELKEQLLQAENKANIEAERRALDWQRERIEDIRRIRSENLEWRTGR
jgi:hypothetical protein